LAPSETVFTVLFTSSGGHAVRHPLAHLIFAPFSDVKRYSVLDEWFTSAPENPVTLADFSVGDDAPDALTIGASTSALRAIAPRGKRKRRALTVLR
jgi:hypothetical protein